MLYLKLGEEKEMCTNIMYYLNLGREKASARRYGIPLAY